MGGFARRMSYFNAFARKYRSRPSLRLDGGSIFNQAVAEAAIVNRWMLEGTYRSNLDGINLSAWDVPVWQELGNLAAMGLIPKEYLTVPLVSANVKPKVNNFPVVQRYILKEYPVDSKTGKRVRIGITGLLIDSRSAYLARTSRLTIPFKLLNRSARNSKGRPTIESLSLTWTWVGRSASL